MSERTFRLLDQMKRYLREREDYIMPLWLPYLPFILVVVSLIILLPLIALASIGTMTSGHMSPGHGSYGPYDFTGVAVGGVLMAMLSLLSLIGTILMIYVIYKWVDRRNKHFERINLFFGVLSEFAVETGMRKADIIRSKINELRIKFQEKSAALYAILSAFIPFVSWYVFHFLNKDFMKHSLDEKIIYTMIYEELRDAGIDVHRRPEEYVTVPDRSTFLYIVLSIVTFGIFYFYWIYTLTEDPNKHFQSHKVFDNEYIDALEKYAKLRLGESGGEGEVL